MPNIYFTHGVSSERIGETCEREHVWFGWAKNKKNDTPHELDNLRRGTRKTRIFLSLQDHNTKLSGIINIFLKNTSLLQLIKNVLGLTYKTGVR